jgi:hypothetical protein
MVLIAASAYVTFEKLVSSSPFSDLFLSIQTFDAIEKEFLHS